MMEEESQIEEIEKPIANSVEVPNASPEVALENEEGQVNSVDQQGVETEVTTTEVTTTGAAFDEALKDAESLSKLGALQGEVQALKSQLEDRTGQYMRIAADFDNYRKRTQREKEEFEQQIKCSTIIEMLPVVDNFERARSQIKPQTEQETTIHKSYQSVYKQLVDCLKRVGVAPMRAQGLEFDPTLHEAVMRQATDEYPEGIVMEELQRGYLIGDRVLRHALVKVAAPLEPVIPSEETDQNNLES
ncbi:nucleotide exchange factor GrpE [Phormidium sp. CLA17]|uniref:nucleotide exchange factor GrpE n=1 Tax=Leptolyngbya sp. Cla-17 TaxID=2803751 RepID=UPI0014921104|nr:nucleotide exchange factor GrpE [Leptolyngbya sp. Cla-17]MBM0740441.1 nucleotide exchange factor GrpE [Leptolyngbya sp. Cla-17]